MKPITTDGMPGFEIFHDVLALPVLEWKREFQARIKSIEDAQLEAKLTRRGSIRFAGVVLGATAVFAAVLWILSVLPWSANLAVVIRNAPNHYILYCTAVLGSIAMEVAAALRLSTVFGGGVPPIYKQPFFLLIRFSFAFLVSGTLPLLLDAQSLWAAFYLGMSAPILFDRLALGLVQRDYRDIS